MMQTRPCRGFTSLRAPSKIFRCQGPRLVAANASHRGTDGDKPADASERGAAPPAEIASTSNRWQPASFLEHGQKSTVLLSTVLAAGLGGLLGLLPELDGPVSALEAIAILCGIVTFHELGHFSAARLQGIHVSKFAIGFGPTLLKFDAGGVEYSLRALPLGGFVAFPDNDEDSPYPPDDPNLLKNRPILDRFFVISAGVVFNIILAFMALTAQVANVGYSDITYKPGVRVPIVLAQSAAARSGILPGDTILALDDKPVEGPDAVKTVVSTIKSHRDLSIDFTVVRNGEVQHVMVLPDIAPDGGGRIGVQLSANATIKMAKPAGILDTLQRAAVEMGRMVSTTVSGLGGLLSNPSEASQTMSGPVAVVAVGAEVARSSPTGLYAFAAVVNINLAVVNVLPLPALDGGYLLLLAIEAARRKKLPDSVEQTFNASGFLLLMGLGVILIVKDTINIFPK